MNPTIVTNAPAGYTHHTFVVKAPTNPSNAATSAVAIRTKKRGASRTVAAFIEMDPHDLAAWCDELQLSDLIVRQPQVAALVRPLSTGGEEVIIRIPRFVRQRPLRCQLVDDSRDDQSPD